MSFVRKVLKFKQQLNVVHLMWFKFKKSGGCMYMFYFKLPDQAGY